ncbi:histidine-type phosphatase [Sphingomonas sp.]|uniref:histidine-type phosphatase n=1 Tax=Sphingomonas sp. TaxID=28214 RepID=UPI003B3AEAE8
MRLRTLVQRALGATLLLAAASAAQAERGLTLERVIVVMRHGVRPPTKAPAMPAGIAADPWPQWQVAPGYLTAHGARAVVLMGRADRGWMSRKGLIPHKGCPANIRLTSDSDQRTIATGDAYLQGLAPGCAIVNHHRPQGEDDPLFRAAGENGAPFDPARANAAVTQALGAGGTPVVEAGQRANLTRLDRILCGGQSSGCGVSREPTRIVPASATRRPKLEGALDRASTAAQILLLEYADGKSMDQVGWGRATAADITALSAFHSLEFQLLARPPYLAAANAAPLARTIADALRDTAPAAPRIVALIGHDTNVASLGGMLGLHWHVPGFAADDPSPGGAIMLEVLRARGGRRYVRVSYRSQSLEQIRTLSPRPPHREVLSIAGCPSLCPLDRVLQALTRIG